MTKRKASGGVFEQRGRLFLRVTVGAGKRQAVAVPWCSSREVALERARAVQALVDRLREASHEELVPKVVEAAGAEDPATLGALSRAVDGLLGGSLVVASPKRETEPSMTLERFAKAWADGTLHARWPDHVPPKEERGAAADARVFRMYVNDLIGKVPVASLTLEHADRVMAALPARLASASRRHVAQALHRVLALAVYPARLLEKSPIPRGWLPKVKRTRAFTFVYPEEDASLMAKTTIPLARRIFFGILAREGLRRDELAHLRWSDLDLERGMIRLDVNKTDDPRAWALDPSVVRTLAAWKARQSPPSAERLVFEVGGRAMSVLKFAEVLRSDLEAAGIERPELYERSEVRRPVRVHDLRASFVTVSLATGKTEAWVSDRTGHRSSEMINRYRRAARTWAEAGLGPFLPLDTAIAWFETRLTSTPPPLPRRRQRSRQQVGGGTSALVSKSAERRGFEPLEPLRVHMISNHAPSTTRSPLPRTRPS